ncbi:exodeoxyribonuclease VII small subunit [Halomonas denitrificans]|nr:exodeoxyribonuclease VII small subunit [Halomonas denitrificans]
MTGSTRSKNASPRTDPPPSFEAQLAELESLVEALESGDLELAESLERFKHGVELSRSCRAMLDAAQQQVDALLDDEAVGTDASNASASNADLEAGSDETSD